ncbi:Oidioi.mRNA.OKI2018_I69.chr2.g7646.t1.cds [Oikopleura dioica]|uniref:Oidioi.mRNA.OKI2018_I69.chr2.g7646.t1.cds n=1 Tax=Oikopleura dioica TaxID=34765 RepID=A0ABN7TAB7_OIKDI|nr:Oidioi.mRNA.OKI2018_I69.chr2.g7646.t1.cds [Oikopleura dioica]
MKVFTSLILGSFFDRAQSTTTFTPVQGIAKTAFEGEIRCRKLGGHLAFFRNAAEFEDFNEATGHGGSNHWIGVQQIGSSSTFKNVDGTTPWLNWNNGEPNNSEERCVELYVQPGDEPAVMNDKSCSASRLYSCRIDDPPTCADIEPNCNASNCATGGFEQMFCPKTFGLCDTWTPQTIGDLTFLDNWTSETCVDKSPACEGWASRNQCMVNPVYMLKKLPCQLQAM